METYIDKTSLLPDFEVSYSFLSEEEGGRKAPPHQHTRWDFLYEGDDPEKDGVNMIWPEIINEYGQVLPEGEIPMKGRALMFVVLASRRPFHFSRIAKGTRGYFVEGARKVAVCTVTKVIGLHENPSS